MTIKAINLFGKNVNIHPRFGNNFLDANALDELGNQEDAAIAEILQRADDFEFTLLLPYSVRKEILDPRTPVAVKRRAQGLIFSMPVQLTAPELATHQRIRTLIQGNAQEGQHEKDAFHLVESAKNGGRHFITNDKRLLKKAPEIWAELGIRVLKPSEFVADYPREMAD
jgi:hypothetical protein